MRDLGNAFWRFWTASTVSALGDGLTFVALPLLAARLTRDPAQIALVQTGQYAAWLAFGLVAGALADRWERRRIMAATDAVRAMLFGAFALAVATGSASLGLVIGLAFVSGMRGSSTRTPRRPSCPRSWDGSSSRWRTPGCRRG